MGSVPRPGGERQPLPSIEGTPPSLTAMPAGCAFHPRCRFATAECRAGGPPVLVAAGDRGSACLHAGCLVGAAAMTEPLIQIREATKSFPVADGVIRRLRGLPRLAVHAVNGVSLDIARGETLGVVGESGCGKSTLARLLVRLYRCDEGRILFEGSDIGLLSGPDLRRFNRRVQMIFQDPMGSLNPRMTVRQMLAEALSVHRMRPKAEIPGRIAELLDLVRLPQDAADRYPHAFSGGQRQRIGIARALAVEPEVLVADELVSRAGRVDPGAGGEPAPRSSGPAGADRGVRRP